jgi:hypothetical protein
VIDAPPDGLAEGDAVEIATGSKGDGKKAAPAHG